MGYTSNRDVSQITKRNRNKAEYSYYTQWQSTTMNTSNALSGVIPPAVTSGQVVAQIKLGCVACYQDQNTYPALTQAQAVASGTVWDPNQPRYPFNPSTGTPWQSS